MNKLDVNLSKLVWLEESITVGYRVYIGVYDDAMPNVCCHLYNLDVSYENKGILSQIKETIPGLKVVSVLGITEEDGYYKTAYNDPGAEEIEIKSFEEFKKYYSLAKVTVSSDRNMDVSLLRLREYFELNGIILGKDSKLENGVLRVEPVVTEKSVNERIKKLFECFCEGYNLVGCIYKAKECTYFKVYDRGGEAIE